MSRVQTHDTGLDLEVDLPITIATIPLRKSYGMINKLVPFNDLSQGNLFNNKTFVTIRHSKFYRFWILCVFFVFFCFCLSDCLSV